MKTLNQYIQEKLIINKDYRDTTIVVKSFDELRKIIVDRYIKLGPGTKQNPIDFNDIDVSNLDSFRGKYKKMGIFEETKFKYIDISYWDVSNVIDMSNMFFLCTELESVGDISGLDISSVTDMSYMFAFCKKFNQDLSKWNVSNVNDMSYMFAFCKKFNQDISRWDVSSVITMFNMFLGCEFFNQDISSWDVSGVTDMEYMFQGCNNFNQNISDWDVSNVTDIRFMFFGCKSFNQDISNWNVSKVMYRMGMFDGCSIKNEYKPKFKQYMKTLNQYIQERLIINKDYRDNTIVVKSVDE